MQITKISISKASIFEEISLATAYTGVKTEAEKGFYDRVATVEEDDTLLSRFVNEMFGEVTDRFREFIYASSNDKDSLNFTLELSGSYDDSLTPSVKEDIFSGIVAGVMARWFRFTFPDGSEEREKQADNLLKRAYAKLCQRRKPKRS